MALPGQNHSVIRTGLSYFLVSVRKGVLFQLTILGCFSSTKAAVYSGIVLFTMCHSIMMLHFSSQEKKMPKYQELF